MKNILAVKSSGFLKSLDEDFLAFLSPSKADLLRDYRVNYQAWNAGEVSKFILDLAPDLEAFLAGVLDIQNQVMAGKAARLSHAPVIAFKKLMVQKAAKLSYDDVSKSEFEALNSWLKDFVDNEDRELVIAELFLLWQEQGLADNLVKLQKWSWYCLHTDFGKMEVDGWPSFQLPDKVVADQLVKVRTARFNSSLSGIKFRHRNGFALTDHGMTERELQLQADYCIYCHKNQGDFCSRGFPVKKSVPELGLKVGVLGDVLTGCPLEEKISEMQYLANKGFSIAALAVIMIDNPLCPATGHRVCNDCMKACVYQKQTPVDIPQIETGALNSVLNLPWGVEIYDILLNWNPLRSSNYILPEPNNHKVMVMGLGPAGFTAANQLLMLGYTVVGVDGLKIEPVEESKYNLLIKDFSSICENLDARSVLGFGGVAEYGITARWNKNYLSLILLVLLRRKQFRVFGGVRFGGTIAVDDVWRLGFDHLVLAVGAGLPRELNIPGSLALGVRVANDFLMALQLSGAHKESSLSSLEVDLPAVVIGGGLTGIDAATELQAYYLLQITKVAARYKMLSQIYTQELLRAKFDDYQLQKIDRWLCHAEQLAVEKAKPRPNIIKLLHSWGGVTVVYRKNMQDSPAYKRNHEELIKALEEGLLYLPCFSPIAIRCDDRGWCQSLALVKMEYVDDAWQVSDHEASIPARTILVATGAQPNVAYGFEHADDFERKRYQYTAYQWQDEGLVASPVKAHCKQENIGMFTSYNKQGKCVSFIGDTHPVFHGSVVKAIASAMYAVPLIHAQLQRHQAQSVRDGFLEFCDDYFSAKIVEKVVENSKEVLLTIKSRAIVSRYKAGNFVRLQCFEKNTASVKGFDLYGEAVAAPIFDVDHSEHTFKVLLHKRFVNEKLFARVKVGDLISAMGPTGVKAKVLAKPIAVLLMVDQELVANLCSILHALKENKNYIILVIRIDYISSFFKEYIEKYVDVIIWETVKDLAVRPQDFLASSVDSWGVLLEFLQQNQSIARTLVDVRLMLQAKRVESVKSKLVEISAVSNIAFEHCSVSVYGPMQCMLKGVCAQCLQWQIDPLTGERTKAVYACSWQDQPLELVDLNHLALRHDNNKPLELLNSFILEELDVD